MFVFKKVPRQQPITTRAAPDLDEKGSIMREVKVREEDNRL